MNRINWVASSSCRMSSACLYNIMYEESCPRDFKSDTELGTGSDFRCDIGQVGKCEARE